MRSAQYKYRIRFGVPNRGSKLNRGWELRRRGREPEVMRFAFGSMRCGNLCEIGVPGQVEHFNRMPSLLKRRCHFEHSKRHEDTFVKQERRWGIDQTDRSLQRDAEPCEDRHT